MKFRIYRYDPDKDAAPRMQDYEVTLDVHDRMLLDAIIRIKASVDLTGLGLSRAALIVATALQTYGAVIGDQTSGPVELKVENVVAEGRGWLWKGVLSATSLSKIPLSSYEIVTLGFGK